MTGQDSPRSEAATHAEFVDLMCADADLLRAEFDAIIAAEFPVRPPSSPSGACRGARARQVRSARRWAARELPLHPRVGATERVIRERSPPPEPVAQTAWYLATQNSQPCDASAEAWIAGPRRRAVRTRARAR